MSAEGWETVCLSDIATIIDCPHSTPKWTELGYFVIRNWNVRNGRLNSDRASYTDKKHFLERIRRSQPELEDLVLTREAPMGEVCMIPDGLECCLGQRVVLLKANHQVVNPAFLLFSIQSPFVKNQINSHEGTGSTVSNLRIPAIANLEVPLPPLPIQTRIASILSALDDKIELNRQANATLEAIAQAIFKEWFVDFRYPGATGERQDVGTGGMNWAGLEPAPTHLIPKGWRVGTFADFVEISGGGTPKTTIDEYWNGGIPWFSVVDAPHESDVFVVDTEKKISQAGVNNSSTKLLREGTTIISARGTVGKVALCGVSMAMNQSCYAINGKQDDWGFFTYYLTRSISLQLQQGANGSVFDTITRSTFEQLTVVLPPPELIASYNNVVTPIFLKIKDHLYQSTILTQARDALLPKLMNGDIPVGAGSKPALSCSQPAQSFGTNTRAGLEPAPTQFVGMASPQGSS